MRRICIFVLILVLIIASSCSIMPDRSNQNVSILSVGLDYKDNIYRDLDGTINDAKEVGMALKSIYDSKGILCNLIYMLQEGYSVPYNDDMYPNKENIIKMIKRQSQNLDADDLFVFFYAGHGQTGPSGEMFLATGYDSTSYSKLGITDLLNALYSLKCRSIVILDSCYSGMLDPSNPTIPGNVAGMTDPQNGNYRNDFSSSLMEIFGKPWYEMSKITVLASASAREVAADGSKVVLSDGTVETHGYFTTALLANLGWCHSKDTVSFINSDEREITVNGYSVGYKGTLSMDDLYLSIMNKWDNRQQNPVLYSTIESVNIIPSK